MAKTYTQDEVNKLVDAAYAKGVAEFREQCEMLVKRANDDRDAQVRQARASVKEYSAKLMAYEGKLDKHPDAKAKSLGK